MSPDPTLSKIDPGRGPQFEAADFPDPPRDLNFRNREVVLVLNILFFGFFFSLFILSQVFGVKF